MNNTLLGFGLFALAASVVGGGLKAFGFELGALTSLTRQAVLALFGAVMVIAAEWHDYVLPLLLSDYTKLNPIISLAPGENHNFSLVLRHQGPVDLLVNTISAESIAGSAREHSLGVYVRICPASPSACDGQQVGSGGAARREVPEGPVTISVFNFDSNPAIKVESSIAYRD